MNRLLRWWTDANPAERYCLVIGVVLGLSGVLGFFQMGGTDFSTGDAVASGEDLGPYHVNGWHNLFHLLSGVFLLLVLNPRVPFRPPLFVLVFGFGYSLLAIFGFNNGEGAVFLGLVALSFGNDAVHVVLGPIGVGAALASRPRPQPAALR